MTNRRPLRDLRDSAGFTLVEAMLMVAIMGLVLSMAVLQISTGQPMQKSDGAMRVVLAQFNTARELAITQRRYMRLNMTSGGSQVQIIREEAPGPALTTIASVQLEGGVVFSLVTGVPDTPDAFGKTSGVSFGSATLVRFATDGTLIDQNGLSLNGTVFLSATNVLRTARAVTVLGSTGRVRGYRFDGLHWNMV
jgi:Tfp pilus assembly protein FimT